MTHEISDEPETSTERVLSFPEVVDSTLLSDFSACPLKAFRRSFLCLSSKEPSIHLHAGGCFAHALEVVRRGVWENGMDFNEALADAYVSFMERWGEVEAPDFGSGANKTFERTWGAVESYFSEYPMHADPIRPYEFGEGKTGIEFKFGIPLDIEHPDTGNPIIFGGRADLLGYHNNLIAIIDEKTTSALGDSWIKQWNLRGQFFGYVWAARKSGIDVKASVVRGISILKTKYGHLQVVKSSYPDFMLDRWERNMKWKILQMKGLYQATKENPNMQAEDIWMMNFADSCNSYGGCSFVDLCTSKDPSDWYGDFGNSRWNPLEEV